mmetsp:Transcript_60592/g.130016  ORF Transcript_60592/g.130016 Transcript_60592/m.130016 type:complete len:256 (+) Transcript_60592:51-818(+)
MNFMPIIAAPAKRCHALVPAREKSRTTLPAIAAAQRPGEAAYRRVARPRCAPAAPARPPAAEAGARAAQGSSVTWRPLGAPSSPRPAAALRNTSPLGPPSPRHAAGAPEAPEAPWAAGRPVASAPRGPAAKPYRSASQGSHEARMGAASAVPRASPKPGQETSAPARAAQRRRVKATASEPPPGVATARQMPSARPETPAATASENSASEKLLPPPPGFATPRERPPLHGGYGASSAGPQFLEGQSARMSTPPGK